MQVRKFEARTMKEALSMIKNQLGPDAIILSAKDIRRNFGLAGETSVEVTAAVSELTLRKKQIAEAKLNDQNKKRFQKISAREQKNFIEKVVTKMENHARSPYKITEMPYIDILDDAPSVESRIKSAAAEAFKAAGEITQAPVKTTLKSHSTHQPSESQQVEALRREILQLKSVIAEFRKVPQTFISMHPGANEGIPYELSFMYEKLTRAGINSELVCEILNESRRALQVTQLKKPALINAWAVKYIMDHIKTVSEKPESRYQVFVGPAGQGKTSSLVKLASHKVLNEKKSVAIVTADTQKVGASEQLKIFSRILNVPFAVVNRPEDWSQLDTALRGCDFIFVDFPGTSLKSSEELDFMKNLMPKNPGRSIHYVLSVLAKDSDAFEIANRYQLLEFNDVIFTGVDESVQHGIIYNFHRKFGVPLHSFGIGTNIPEDFEMASRERVVDLIFKLTKISKERGLA